MKQMQLGLPETERRPRKPVRMAVEVRRRLIRLMAMAIRAVSESPKGGSDERQ
jgi:hypothetical protein